MRICGCAHDRLMYSFYCSRFLFLKFHNEIPEVTGPNLDMYYYLVNQQFSALNICHFFWRQLRGNVQETN